MSRCLKAKVMTARAPLEGQCRFVRMLRLERSPKALMVVSGYCCGLGIVTRLDQRKFSRILLQVCAFFFHFISLSVSCVCKHRCRWCVPSLDGD